MRRQYTAGHIFSYSTEYSLVHVVLARAAARVGGGSGLTLGHANIPSVVLANGDEHVAVVVVDELRQELGTLLDVVVRVLAVTTRRSATLVLRAN